MIEKKDATTTAIPVFKPQFGDSESSGSEFSSTQGHGSSLGQYPDVTRSCQRAKSRQFSRVSSSLDGSFDEADNARSKSRYCGVSPFWNASSKMGLIPESRVFQLLGGLGSPEPNESSEDEDTDANTTVIEVCKPDDGPSSSCSIPQAQNIAKQIPDQHSVTSLMSASSPALRDEPVSASVDEPPPCEEPAITPPNEPPAEENIIQEPVHNFAELKPTKQLTMQALLSWSPKLLWFLLMVFKITGFGGSWRAAIHDHSSYSIWALCRIETGSGCLQGKIVNRPAPDSGTNPAGESKSHCVPQTSLMLAKQYLYR